MQGLDLSLTARVVVRVLDRAGDPVGAGFLIGPDQVATCAHVVAAALGGDPYATAAPSASVGLDFPLFRHEGTNRPAATCAEVERWLPIADDGSGDIAVLRLHDPVPDGARMPPLRRMDRLWGHPFRVLGFPPGLADGVWATGRIRGEQGTRWFQLQATVGDQPIVEGFSGAPVWDDETGAVVGMAVATDATGATTTAYLIPIDQVLGIDPALLPCPYRGLEAFGEEDAPYFFGRDADIAQLVDAVAGRPLVAVAGPSGSGKSSLVRAGLVPRLRAAGNSVTELRLLPGEPVLEVLTAALLPGAAPSGDSPGAVLRQLAGAAAATRAVLVVDQFEELAATDPDQAGELLAAIGELVQVLPRKADGSWPVRVVLTLRSATLDDVAAREIAGLLGAGTVLLPPMDRRQLRDAIVAPAERAPGLSFEPGLVDRILDDAAAEPGQLPLVESLLTELWERRDGGYLTLAAYERAGGVAGVVATHAENVVARFTDPADEPRLRRLFTSLAGPDRDGRFVRRSMPLHELADDLLTPVQALTAGRLLVIERASNGADHVQLAHQALIAHWPRLQAWLAADRDFLSWRDQLDQQRQRWEAGGRDDGALLRGSALAAAEEFLPERAEDVAVPDVEYVRQSRARQRREVRRWRIVTAVLAVLLVAAGSLAAVTISSRNQITEQLRLADAEIVAQAALARTGIDPVTATELALTAFKLDPSNGAARTALARQYLAMRSVVTVYTGLTDSRIDGLGTATDASRVMLPAGNGLVIVGGLPTDEPTRWVVPDVPAGFLKANLTADGQRLDLIDAQGGLWTWDVAARRGPTRLPVDTTGMDAGTAQFAPDGKRIVWLRSVAPGVHAVEVRDTSTGAVVPHQVAPVAGPDGLHVALAADPNVLVVRLDGPGEVSITGIRSLADGSQLQEFPAGSALAADSLVVSCEPGPTPAAVIRRMGSRTESGRVALLRPCSGNAPLTLSEDRNDLVEFRPVTGDPDYAIARVTRLSDGRAYEMVLPRDKGAEVAPSVPRSIVAVPGGDDAITLLVARGSALLKMRAEALPAAAPDELHRSDDGRFAVGLIGSDYTVYDDHQHSLTTLSRQAVVAPGEFTVTVSDSVSIVERGPDAWTVDNLALPTLERTFHQVLPAAQDSRRTNVVVSSDHVTTLSGGLLSAWRLPSGLPIGHAVQLGSTSALAAWYASPLGLREQAGVPGSGRAARPRRPDRVVGHRLRPAPVDTAGHRPAGARCTDVRPVRHAAGRFHVGPHGRGVERRHATAAPAAVPRPPERHCHRVQRRRPAHHGQRGGCREERERDLLGHLRRARERHGDLPPAEHDRSHDHRRARRRRRRPERDAALHSPHDCPRVVLHPLCLLRPAAHPRGTEPAPRRYRHRSTLRLVLRSMDRPQDRPQDRPPMKPRSPTVDLVRLGAGADTGMRSRAASRRQRCGGQRSRSRFRPPAAW